MKTFPFAAAVLLLSLGRLSAGCIMPAGDEQLFSEAAAVGEISPTAKTVLRLDDGRIITRYSLSLSRNFKGGLPGQFTIDTAGGALGNEIARSSDSLDLEIGQSYVLRFSRDAADAWVADPFSAIPIPADATRAQEIRRFYQGGAKDSSFSASSSTRAKTTKDAIPTSRITPTGYVETASVPTRFTEFDAGFEIPYFIDVDASKLPTGVSQADAITAVGNAFAAWSAASSVKYRYAGLYSPGAAANATNATKTGTILIQLHDTYNAIVGSSTLGIGGGSYSTGSAGSPVGAYAGGRVGSQVFQKRYKGYIIMNHRATSFNSNPLLYGEVLTHEIGHSLGLAHSSEDPAEPDAILHAATMFYAANNDGRGTAIKAYDADRIIFGYPISNTPPFSMDRVLTCVTGTPKATGYGIDRISVIGSDLQTPGSITWQLVPGSEVGSGGAFTTSGNTIIFTPDAVYGNALLPAADIESGTYYKRVSFQFSDGVNLSPAYTVRIIGFQKDTSTSDGLPDTWMTANFGTTTPGAVGSDRHPDSDPDKDGLSNRTEFYLGTNPNDAKSGMPQLGYSASQLTLSPTRYAPLVIQTSTDCSNWTLFRLYHSIEAATPALVPIKDDGALPKKFYRLSITP